MTSGEAGRAVSDPRLWRVVLMHGDSCDLLVGDGVPVGLDQRLVNVQSTGLSGPGSDRGLLFSAVTRRERRRGSVLFV